MNPSPELLHGTLDTLVLKTLAGGRRHGYGIARAIEDATEGVVDIEEGSLYPALYRMEREGLGRGRVGRLRARPPREVLPAHAERPPSADGADRRMGALRRRHLRVRYSCELRTEPNLKTLNLT